MNRCSMPAVWKTQVPAVSESAVGARPAFYLVFVYSENSAGPERHVHHAALLLFHGVQGTYLDFWVPKSMASVVLPPQGVADRKLAHRYGYPYPPNRVGYLAVPYPNNQNDPVSCMGF